MTGRGTEKFHSKHNSCRLCQSSLMQCVLPLDPVPIGEHYTKEPKVEDAPRFPLGIYQCMSCMSVQTNDNIDSRFLWKDYTYYSGQTKKIVEHFESFTENIFKTYKLIETGSVLDIGSNDGSLLKCFKDKGWEVQGVDPADTVANTAIKNGINTHIGLFGSKEINKKLGKQKFDLITAFNVFAHSDNMESMANQVKDSLASNGIFAFEVQYLADILNKNILGTFFHEHMIHYSYTAAESFLNRYGLKIFDYSRNNIQNGSIIFFCKQSPKSSEIFSEKLEALKRYEEELELTNSNWAKVFYQNILSTRNSVQEFLKNFEIEYKSLGAYGAARSGPTLAIQYGLDNYISHLYDDHPSKIDKYSPYQSLKVESTSKLSTNSTNITVILAYIHYKAIIKKHIDYLEDGGIFILLWPEFSIIDINNYKEYI